METTRVTISAEDEIALQEVYDSLLCCEQKEQFLEQFLDIAPRISGNQVM